MHKPGIAEEVAEMLVWQQAGGKRHGRDGADRKPLDAGDVFHSLCGRTLTVSARDEHSPDKPWLDPTCSACDTYIRRELGITRQVAVA